MRQLDQIDGFVTSFENEFNELLLDPRVVGEQPHLIDYPGPYSRTRYANKPRHRLSDIDLVYWLDGEKVGAAEVEAIDIYLRNYPDFTHMGLVTTADKQPNHLQYMAHVPGLSAPSFIDINLRGAMTVEAFQSAFSRQEDPDEHKRWVLLTCWRKIGKDDQAWARNNFYRHNRTYWNARDGFFFMANPERFFSTEFPDVDYPRILTEVGAD